jgi:hypothetical protein
MFDQEEYFRRNKWGSIYLPPFRDLREPPEPKNDGWKMGVLVAVAVSLILVIVLGVGA